jgi:hypothetical protein
MFSTKNSSRAHTKSELGVLGVHGKLVKYVVHSSKRANAWLGGSLATFKLPKSPYQLFILKVDFFFFQFCINSSLYMKLN